jgi:phospholipase C
VITRAYVNELREIPQFSTVQNGPNLEYRFRMTFRRAADVQGTPKIVRLTLLHEGTGQKPPIEVTLQKPGGAEETLETPMTARSASSGTRSGGAAVAATLRPIESSSDPASFQLARSVRPMGPGRFGPLDDILDVDEEPPIVEPPPIDVDRYEYQIQEDDPNGDWVIRIRNRGSAPSIFRVTILHPHMQLQLTSSRIPFSLMRRVLNHLNRYIGIRVRIDRTATIDFRDEFKRLTGLPPLSYEVGVIGEIPHIGNDIYLKDINLHDLDIGIVRTSNTSVSLTANADFETEGPEEIDINNWDDVDIEDLAVGAALEFSGLPNWVYSENRDLAGNTLSAFAPSGQVTLKIEANVSTDDWEGLIRERVKDKIRSFISKEETRRALNVVAEHLTDVFMFLAVGNRDRLFYDVRPTETDIVVRHYSKPKERLVALPFDVLEPLRDVQGTRTLAEPSGSPATATPPESWVPAAGEFVRIHDALLEAGNRIRRIPGRKIDHIVVLMLENRSFDHMLGYLKVRGGRSDIDGLGPPGNHTNPVPGSTQEHAVYRVQEGGIVRFDPGHGTAAVSEQIAGGAMSGFVANYMSRSVVRDRPGEERLVMGFYAEDLLSTFDDLAREFLVCDRWFCSHPGPTHPNRMISLMGSALSLSNLHVDSPLLGTIENDTIFDLLTEADVSWKYVESNIAFLRLFDKYRVDESNIVQLTDWLQLARSGQLPAVSWIDPHFGDIDIDDVANDDHPPANITMGQVLVKSIYDAITANQEQWRRTLFAVTYDEHGGFYDHVPPPGLSQVDPSVPRVSPDGPTHYGPRVPTLIVSPWVKRGGVSSTVFDHTSLLKTILVNFLGPEWAGRGVLGERTDAASDLLDLLEGTVRTDVPQVDQPAPAPPSTGAVTPTERDSFHLGIRLFGFGPKLRDIAASRVDE